MARSRESQKIYLKKLSKRVDDILTEAYRNPMDILNEKRGITAECTLCERSKKLCEKFPGRHCARVYKAGTLLEEYQSAIHRIYSETYGICLCCGGRIEASRLSRQPETVLCMSCSLE